MTVSDISAAALGEAEITTGPTAFISLQNRSHAVRTTSNMYRVPVGDIRFRMFFAMAYPMAPKPTPGSVLVYSW